MTPQPSTKNNWGRALILGWLGWTIYAALYALVLTLQTGLFYPFALSGSLLSHYLMALYSIPIWFLTMRVLAPHAWPTHVLGHCVASAAFAFGWHASLLQLFRLLFGEAVWQSAKLFDIKYWLLHEALIVYGVFVGLFYARRYQQQLLAHERQEADLRLHAKQMELTLLKGQLNPHFLFNTLNSINALVGSNPEGARHVLARLAEVLRYSLESDRRALVPLSEELRFVETYLEIEKARFGKRLQVSWAVDEAARALLVPPMIIQPLAENAVRHGLAPKEEGGELAVRIERQNGQLAIAVTDNGVGAAHASQIELLQRGTGLRNTDLRLRKMFGENAGLQISADANGFRVRFALPLAQVEHAGT
ncbi:MAG: histidine kinase [candidate division KSB1 bacterium]